MLTASFTSTWPCGVPGCAGRVQRDSQTGFCSVFHMKEQVKARKGPKPPPATCKAPGCAVQLAPANPTGYCTDLHSQEHATSLEAILLERSAALPPSAKRCRAPDCPGRVTEDNRTGWCTVFHRAQWDADYKRLRAEGSAMGEPSRPPPDPEPAPAGFRPPARPEEEFFCAHYQRRVSGHTCVQRQRADPSSTNYDYCAIRGLCGRGALVLAQLGSAVAPPPPPPPPLLLRCPVCAKKLTRGQGRGGLHITCWKRTKTGPVPKPEDTRIGVSSTKHSIAHTAARLRAEREGKATPKPTGDPSTLERRLRVEAQQHAALSARLPPRPAHRGAAVLLNAPPEPRPEPLPSVLSPIPEARRLPYLPPATPPPEGAEAEVRRSPPAPRPAPPRRIPELELDEEDELELDEEDELELELEVEVQVDLDDEDLEEEPAAHRSEPQALAAVLEEGVASLFGPGGHAEQLLAQPPAPPPAPPQAEPIPTPKEEPMADRLCESCKKKLHGNRAKSLCIECESEEKSNQAGEPKPAPAPAAAPPAAAPVAGPQLPRALRATLDALSPGDLVLAIVHLEARATAAADALDREAQTKMEQAAALRRRAPAQPPAEAAE